jgi:hypothetical protein
MVRGKHPTEVAAPRGRPIRCIIGASKVNDASLFSAGRPFLYERLGFGRGTGRLPPTCWTALIASLDRRVAELAATTSVEMEKCRVT